MAKLSVVINAYNVENDLPRSISSVKSFADEIVVIDQGSSDSTAAVAKKLGAKVFDHKSVDYVELARNYAISKASCDWVLVLDPDEEIPTSLAKKISVVLKAPDADYYRLPRKNIIFGKWMKHSRWWPDYNIRLFKKDFVSWNEIIHGVPLTKGKGEYLETNEESAIVHYHYDSIEQYVDRLNRYTSAQAKLKLKEDYKFSWHDLLSKPSNEFFSRYFFGEGYKDGLHGLALSLLQSFSELVLYLKIWQLNKFEEKRIALKDVISVMNIQERDAKYWKADSMYKESGSLEQRVRRKLKI